MRRLIYHNHYFPKTLECNMKIAACLLRLFRILSLKRKLEAKQSFMGPVSFFQHFDQNCNKPNNKPNNKPYHDHSWKLFTFSLSSQWRRISFKLESYFNHCLRSISFAIRPILHPLEFAVNIPWDQANFIGCHKVIWQFTKQLTNNIWSTDRFPICKTLTSLYNLSKWIWVVYTNSRVKNWSV